MNFRDYQVSILPPWLRGTKGEAYTKALGDVKDALTDVAKLSVQSSMATLAPGDAVGFLGVEAGVARVIGDSRATYAARVKAAWNLWRWAGTAFGVLRALSASGFPGAELVVARGVGYRLAPDGESAVLVRFADGPWVLDGATSWTRFEVILPAPHPWCTGVVASVAGNGGLLPGGFPAAPTHYRLDVAEGGTVESGGAVVVNVRVDGVPDAPITVPRSGDFALPGGGRATAWGELTVGDSLEWDGVTPSGDIINQIHSVVEQWAPAFATYLGVLVHQSGNLSALSAVGSGTLTPTVSGSGAVCGSGVATYWAP